MRRAFSLTELFVTLAIMAIVLGVVIVSYNNLKEDAETVVKEDVQRSFLRALETFRSSGGNIDVIIAASLDTTDKGYALLQALKSTADTDVRNATGRVSSLVPQDARLIAVTLDDGSPRLRFVGDSVSLETSGTGFYVSNDPSVEGSPISNPTDVNNVVNNSINSIQSGSLYASASSYLWDEDSSLIEGPSSMGGSTGPVSSGLTGSEIVIAFGDSISGAPNPAPMSYTYEDYNSGSAVIEAFAYRRDTIPLKVEDVTFTTKFDSVSVGTASSATRNVYNSEIVSSGGTPLEGVLITLNTKDLKAANTWNMASYGLRAEARATPLGSSEKGLTSATAARNVSAIPVKLNKPTIAQSSDTDGDGVIDYGDSVTIDVRPNNSSIPLAAMTAGVLNNGGLTISNNVTGGVKLTLPNP